MIVCNTSGRASTLECFSCLTSVFSFCGRAKRGRGAVGSRMDETGPYLAPCNVSDSSWPTSSNVTTDRRVLYGPDKPNSLNSYSSSEEESDSDRRKRSKRSSHKHEEESDSDRRKRSKRSSHKQHSKDHKSSKHKSEKKRKKESKKRKCRK